VGGLTEWSSWILRLSTHHRITPYLVHRLERKVTKFDFMEELTRE
jgi:hypothetical protein